MRKALSEFFDFRFSFLKLFRLLQMARRNFETSDLGSMTISALKNRRLVGDAFFALADFRDDLRAVTRTRTARQKRHVGVGQQFQIRRLRYADMTNRAVFVRVIFARVIEFQGKTAHRFRFEIRRSQFMTTRAIGAYRFLCLIMTAKTRSVIVRRIFEKFGFGNESFDGRFFQHFRPKRL